jgi:hypothetical protein
MTWADGDGVMKDENLKHEEIEASRTLAGAGESPLNREEKRV